MKKRLVTLLVASSLVAAFWFDCAFAAGQKIRILVDDKEVTTDVDPFEKDGRVMVPVRFVAEALGCNVGWEEATSTVKVYSQDYKVPGSGPGGKIQIILEPTQAQIDEAAEISKYNTTIPFDWAPYNKTWTRGSDRVDVEIVTAWSSYVRSSARNSRNLRTPSQEEWARQNVKDGHVVVYATALGHSSIFTQQGFQGMLMQGWNMILPLNESKPNSPDHSEHWPNDPAYQATICLSFSLSEINPDDPMVKFILALPNGVWANAVFDLSKLQ